MFVTGGTGFIGQYVLKRLAESGHSMRCLVRKASDTSTPKEVDAEIVVGDVTDRASLKRRWPGQTP